MRQASLIVLILLCVCGASADTPPLAGAAGATLEDIAGTETLVTVVLEPTGAQDKNLHVMEVRPDSIAVMSDKGKRHTYLFRSIRQVRVQDGKVKVEPFRPSERFGLSPAHEGILMRAIERAEELFVGGSANQNHRMTAAVVMAVGPEGESQEEAIRYLREIHESNDLATAVSAGFRLYLVGMGDELNGQVLEDGLNSGNQQIRSKAARLAGLVGFKPGAAKLRTMLLDRRAEICGPAAIALARMGDREIIPTVIGMLSAGNPDKGEAAIDALEIIGDEQTAAELKTMLLSAEGMTRYRVAKVLHSIGDPESARVLRDEILNVPTLQVSAALTLAAEGDIGAQRILRERLADQPDEKESALLLRAEMAAALVEGSDRTMAPVLQVLLRSDFPVVQERVCQLIARLGARSLVGMLQPSLESPNDRLVLSACQATLALVNPQYRERLIEVWE